MDIKIEVLEKDKDFLEEKLGEANTESRNLRKSIDNLKKTKYKSDESLEKLNEKVIMLENVVSTRDTEIYLISEKLDSFEASTASCKVFANETDGDVPTTSKCGDCDYDSQDESDMKKHMQSIHDCKCKLCNIVFINESFLKEHVKKRT